MDRVILLSRLSFRCLRRRRKRSRREEKRKEGENVREMSKGIKTVYTRNEQCIDGYQTSITSRTYCRLEDL